MGAECLEAFAAASNANAGECYVSFGTCIKCWKGDGRVWVVEKRALLGRSKGLDTIEGNRNRYSTYQSGSLFAVSHNTRCPVRHLADWTEGIMMKIVFELTLVDFSRALFPRYSGGI